jgi:AcrR family transcriptional regulator
MRGAAETRAARRGAGVRKPRLRRTQAQRTAETRAAIVAAVVDSIGAVGFQRTTASEIARRAGVTWGAVQHHFGGKDGALAAVLQDSVARFAERIDAEPLAALPLHELVSRFTRAAWDHFSSPHFRSMLEILLHHNGAGGAAADDSQRELLRAFDRVWTPVFSDTALPRRQRSALQNYTVAVLSGLAIQHAFEGGGRAPTGELELLEGTLLRAMTGA